MSKNEKILGLAAYTVICILLFILITLSTIKNNDDKADAHNYKVMMEFYERELFDLRQEHGDTKRELFKLRDEIEKNSLDQ